ncbi:MAG: 23S rRNA (adenine(2030)-N(6))-methyltransferase RlmJ [Pseudolabrys sp.]
MNYRHAFHAGNFADVHKHVVLTRILHYLCEKQAAFRVLDTHAGAGLYDLSEPEAQRSGEWRDGVARLMVASLAPDAAALIAPYRDAVAALNTPDRLVRYPGSPALTRVMLRPQDRMIACELEPQAAAALARNLGGDPRIKTIAIDGWTALSAYLPPKERRGLVLIDPPFEDAREFARLADSLAQAHRKWATGIYMIWYPIKGRTEPDALAKKLRRFGIAKVLRSELIVAPLSDPSRLNGSGLIVVNPPWTLEKELAVLLPALLRMLRREDQSGFKGSFKLDWLAGERAAAGG